MRKYLAPTLILFISCTQHPVAPQMRSAASETNTAIQRTPASNPNLEKIRAYRKANEYGIIRELMDFSKLPNIATNVDDIRKNAEYLMQLMAKRGIKGKILNSKNGQAPPSVYGEIKTPGAKRTLTLYAHFDGVPVNPDKWKITKPFEPVVVEQTASGPKYISFDQPVSPINPEWRVYGRSVSDDRAGVMGILNALDAIKQSGLSLTSNIKLFFEGEEEQISPNLGDILATNAGLLKSDMWVILDGPSAITGQKIAAFGARGIKWIEVTVYGPIRPLHSGHYGNWAPNPAVKLSRLIASMIDDDGRITIERYNDDGEPLGATERKAIEEAATSDPLIKDSFGICRPDGGGRPLNDLVTEPSLNVRGLWGGEVGEKAANLIPAKAIAAFDIRMTKGNDLDRQPRKVIDHIRRQGYYVIEVDDSKQDKDRDPTPQERKQNPLIAKVRILKGGYDAYRISMDHQLANQAIAAAQSVLNQPIRRIPTVGASTPYSIMDQVLHTPMLSFSVNNYDNNQHSEDENLRIQNLWDTIELIAAVATM